MHDRNFETFWRFYFYIRYVFEFNGFLAKEKNSIPQSVKVSKMTLGQISSNCLQCQVCRGMRTLFLSGLICNFKSVLLSRLEKSTCFWKMIEYNSVILILSWHVFGSLKTCLKSVYTCTCTITFIFKTTLFCHFLMRGTELFTEFRLDRNFLWLSQLFYKMLNFLTNI